jgi:hypothetical protein
MMERLLGTSIRGRHRGFPPNSFLKAVYEPMGTGVPESTRDYATSATLTIVLLLAFLPTGSKSPVE